MSGLSLAGYAAFGVAVRWVQLGIQWRPFWAAHDIWGYPGYGAVAAGIGYYLNGMEERQMAILNARKEKLLEKRRRAAERREAGEAE